MFGHDMEMPRILGIRPWAAANRERVSGITAPNRHLRLITIVPRAYMLTTARDIEGMARLMRAYARLDIEKLAAAVSIDGRPAPFIARLEFDLISQDGDISETKAALLESLGIDIKRFAASRQGHAILVPHYHLVLDARNHAGDAIKRAIHAAWPGERQAHVAGFHLSNPVAQNLEKVGRYIFKCSFRHTTTYDGGATRDLEPYAPEWERWTRCLINAVGLANLVFDRLGVAESLEIQDGQRPVPLNEDEMKKIIPMGDVRPSRLHWTNCVATTLSPTIEEIITPHRHNLLE